MLKLAISSPRLRLPGGNIAFAVYTAFAAAAAFGLVGMPGLAAALLIALATRNGPTIIILASVIAACVLLKSFGNWYAAHKAVKVITGIALLSSAFLNLPAGVRQRLANLSVRSFAFWCVAVPVYLLQCFNHAPMSSGDTKPVLPTVVQMLSHGNRDLSAWHDGRWRGFGDGTPYFLRTVNGRAGLYSTYPAGMEIFALPAAAVIVAADLESTPSRINTAERISSRLLTAMTLAMFFLLASHFVNRLTAWTATAFLALGSTFTSTSGNELWQQTGVAFWILVVLLAEVKGRRGWLVALACAGMLACRPTAVSFLIPYGIYRLIESRRGAVMLVLQSVVCYAPWALMYFTLYGTPFGPSMRFASDDWIPGRHLAGVLISPARGLLIYQSWIALMLIKQPWPRWKQMLLGVFACHTLLIASWPIWWGGHCYGSRLMAEAVLIGAVLVLEPLQAILARAWGRWLAGLLLAVGMCLHFPGAFGNAMAWNAVPRAVDEDRSRLWDWSRPPMLYDFQQ